MTVADSQTARLLGQGRRLEHFTIGWNVLEAGVSVWAGIVAGSTALIGFGLDSAHIAATETPFPEKNWWRCPQFAGGVSRPSRTHTSSPTVTVASVKKFQRT